MNTFAVFMAGFAVGGLVVFMAINFAVKTKKRLM